MTHPAVGGLALAVYYAFVTPVALVARALGIGRRAVGTPAWIERDDRADSPRRT